MNVGVIAPMPGDGTSFYRAFGPLGALSRASGIRLITSPTGDWDWPQITQCNVMFLQRPFTPAHQIVASICQVTGTPLWVDYDDLYRGFPPWICDLKEMYGSERALSVIQSCIAMADVVTVSTEFLREEYRPKAEVIPNALNNTMFGFSEGRRAKTISWRGSGGHKGDLEPFLPALRRVKELDDYGFHFFGNPHWACYDLGLVTPYTNLWDYMVKFIDARPAINIVPLVDCEFNRAKSNIAWIEATIAGAITIAPNWPEWTRPGVINYSDVRSFEVCLHHAMKMSDAEREANVELSRQFISENLSLPAVNEKRWEILQRFKP